MSESAFKVTYVVTTDGRDQFGDMALVSMLSVRISNPGFRIVVVCDEPSANAIKAVKHRLIEVCDEIISVPTPAGEPTFRNRWIKTQLNKYVSGDVLHLDADTLVRGSLVELPCLVKEFGAVPNHNGSTLAEQVWDEDRRVYEQMGWPSGFTMFVNGGIWFCKAGPRINAFFQKWHEFWLAGVAANGRLRDQPSLNSALLASGICPSVLPQAYNLQMAKSWTGSSRARIWHFYASEGAGSNSFTRLTKGADRWSLDKLRRGVAKALNAPAPWANTGWFARIIANQAERRGEVKTEETLWLNCRRKDAVRFFLGKYRRKLAMGISQKQLSN